MEKNGSKRTRWETAKAGLCLLVTVGCVRPRDISVSRRAWNGTGAGRENSPAGARGTRQDPNAGVMAVSTQPPPSSDCQRAGKPKGQQALRHSHKGKQRNAVSNKSQDMAGADSESKRKAGLQIHHCQR